MSNDNKQKICFIINPISGVGKQKIVEKNVDLYLNKDKYEYEIFYTECQGHAILLAKEAIEKNFDIIVAVGGDGSVNEVARSLVGTNVKMGIIPVGSGNGLARYLNIPLNLKKAIEVINNGNVKTIDTALINDELFVSMAGVGFDAVVAKEFAKTKKRGFWGYLKMVLKRYFTYKPKKYRIITSNGEYKCRALFISFANSNQFGYGSVIAPEASIDDGMIDICILKKPPLLKSLFITFRLFNKTINNSKYYQLIRVSEATIKRKKNKVIHIDGDPRKLTSTDIFIKVNPKSLNVIVP